VGTTQRPVYCKQDRRGTWIVRIQGVSRLRKKVFTTQQDPDVTRAPDLVDRDFTATRPDALWVTDLTYVPTRSGMADVCFIVDAFSRRIVGGAPRRTCKPRWSWTLWRWPGPPAVATVSSGS